MRLFIAVDLPAELRGRMGALQSRLRGRYRGWRWVRPAGIHLTLRFLGEVRHEDDAAQRAAWRAAAFSCLPASFSVGGLGVFPAPNRPRVLWTGVREEPSGGRLVALASALESAARREGFPPETRSFRPHLTLARAERGGRPQVPPSDEAEELGRVLATEVVLFRSELRPEGARYTPLEAFPLGPAS